MRQPEAEARRWLAQAESDLAFAEVGVREGFFAQTFHYRRGARIVLGHSLVELRQDLTGDPPPIATEPARRARRPS